MRHNSVVSSYPKSTGIPLVDGLSIGSLGFRASHVISMFFVYFKFEVVFLFLRNY